MKKTSREKDQFTVVLEDINSKFDLFTESIGSVHQKLESHETRFDEMDVRFDLFAKSMSLVHQKLDKHDEKLNSIDTKLDNLSDDMFVVKETIKIIRGDLKQKVDYEEFESLEKRVALLENKGKK